MTETKLLKESGNLEFTVEDNSTLNLILNQNVNTSLNIKLKTNAQTKIILITTTPEKIETQITVTYLGKNANAELRGLSLLSGNAHHITKTNLQITTPENEASQVFKSIVSDTSTNEYHGLVHIHPNAQLINSDQLNRNLILSDGAKAISNPQLEIYADDVKCTHGATTADIEAHELLYLQSRGLNAAQAKSLLLRGFTDEILNEIQDEAIRNQIKSEIDPILKAY